MEDCAKVNNQINRIKGQVDGIKKMIEERRDSLEIVQQISAVRASLSTLAKELLKEESKTCLEKQSTEGKIKKFEELIQSFFKIS